MNSDYSLAAQPAASSRNAALPHVLPVLDLLSSRVVRGVAGDRANYRPIESRLCVDASPQGVAAGLREAFGFSECYVADLDAIAGGEPQRHALEVVVSSGLTPWIDAGLRSADQARLLVDFLESQSPRARIVASLESVPDLLTLTAIGRAVRWERLVFSLDLKNGRPLASSMGWAGQTPEEIAEQVIAVGVRSLIVLDLAGVGVGEGVPTLELCRRLRARFTQLELISGGGVRDVDDLRTLAASGCDTALVASALHDGRITRELLAAAAH